ncbi:MAG: hypothetical protein KJP02_02335 [Octadecabacter sp.]|nr:hypothetical protein [Octadecabacter sp.]
MIKLLVKNLTTALTLSAMTLGTTVLVTATSTTAAFAERGGNGNGNGQNNRNAREERTNNGNGNDQVNGNNGRGAIARELRGLNAAQANQNALENASPNSMPGKLYAYQQAQIAASEVDAKVIEAANFYAALENMGEDRFNELNPDLDYASTLATAGADYQTAMQAQANTAATTEQTLATLTNGRGLSEAAMAELHRMLGL